MDGILQVPLHQRKNRLTGGGRMVRWSLVFELELPLSWGAILYETVVDFIRNGSRAAVRSASIIVILEKPSGGISHIH